MSAEPFDTEGLGILGITNLLLKLFIYVLLDGLDMGECTYFLIYDVNYLIKEFVIIQFVRACLFPTF